MKYGMETPSEAIRHMISEQTNQQQLREGFQSLFARVWSAATTLHVFGEIEDKIFSESGTDSFTLRTGNAWCRLLLDQKDRIIGTYGYSGPGFEVEVRELFTINGSSFDNLEVMADFVIVELLRALTSQSTCTNFHF